MASALPMLGRDYLNHVWKGTGGKLKALVRPLLKDGIGDRMDKGNLWVVPGFTLLVFAVLWTTKLSKIALDESTCRGASVYDFTGTQLDDDAKRHCQTAKRYWLGVNEAFSLDPYKRASREVKNPEWILWFWGPIVFVMYVLTRFIWTVLMDNQGVNFQNVISAAQSITVENDGITEIDEEKLMDRLPVIAENFRCAYSTRAFGAFLAFEFGLVVAPMVLLVFILPLMIGPNYRTWGFDIAKAWAHGRDWQGTPLAPMFGSGDEDSMYSQMRLPLIPRITYCDYNFVSLGNSHTLTYRCYLDANWHERTALFTWAMLVFLAFINLGNFVFWLEWAFRMRNRSQRRGYVIKKWLNTDGFSDFEIAKMLQFAEGFKMGQLLYFYYIEAHTDRVVATAFCTALYARWVEKKRRQSASASHMISPKPNDGGMGILMPPGMHPSQDCGEMDYKPPSQHWWSFLCLWPQKNRRKSSSNYPLSPGGGGQNEQQRMFVPMQQVEGKFVYPNMIGWNLENGNGNNGHMVYPTAPFATPPHAASFSDTSTMPMSPNFAIETPKSTGNASAMPLSLEMPETSNSAAMIGRMKARCPNIAAEVGRDSIEFDSVGKRMSRKNSRQPLKKMERHVEDDEDREDGEIVENVSEIDSERSINESTPLRKKQSVGAGSEDATTDSERPDPQQRARTKTPKRK